MALKLESVSPLIGSDVEDVYGRVVGTLVCVTSDMNGNVKSVDIKIADRAIETVPAERLTLRDGKLVVIPSWRHVATTVIEALDRAYRRRRALDTMASSDLPGEIVESYKRSIAEEIRELKVRAEEAKKAIKDRLASLEDEALAVAKAIASLQILYFSGEVSEKVYNQSMNHLRKMRDKITEEKNDAKRVLDKLEKTLEAALAPAPREEAKQQPQQQPQQQQQRPPTQQPQPILVKVEEA
ncbi:MAG: CdvA-like protein [Acidilobaceae archaeon]